MSADPTGAGPGPQLEVDELLTDSAERLLADTCTFDAVQQAETDAAPQQKQQKHKIHP